MTDAPTDQKIHRRRGLQRLAVLAVTVVMVLIVWISNQFLTERFTESTRNRAEVRLALYSGNLRSELQRNSIVPQLLARDPALIGALNSADYSQSTQRLLSFVDEIGAASLMLLDIDGRTVAATDRTRLGEAHKDKPYFIDALRSNQTIFTKYQSDKGGYEFIYSRKISSSGQVLGVIVVAVDLAQMERAWARTTDAVMVTDSEGKIILASDVTWRGFIEEEALELLSADAAIDQAFEQDDVWRRSLLDTYLGNDAVMRSELRVPFKGWRMISFTPYTSVRERVNGILAIEIMLFAVLLSLLFLYLNRRAASKVSQVQRESAELRALNQRLQNEIAQRERAEMNLQVAEQTIEQSSKLAALGQMSAGISHELNQPLAAMKTYLAGARLLLQRRRPDEALTAFQRIDDLISRMGAITRQLKSYARKGSDAFEPVNARAAVSTALGMMEPQLKARDVAINHVLPSGPVMIYGDQLRLEQVVVNLLRNAFDATIGIKNPQIDLILTQGETVKVTVRDNGHGIADLDALFEPFYTTKQPGDGVGLGLAISSGIVSDLGGRLTARNAARGGAVFEVELPPFNEDNIKKVG